MMNQAVITMLEKYDCKSARDFENALKEIIQEIALLGLWRTSFFDHAAFYGGTALRILYGLPRFSEDLDFSLLKPDPVFSLDKYLGAIQNELAAFGFEVTVETKKKAVISQVDSAFIKAGTKEHLIKIQAAAPLAQRVQANQNLTIKLEVDTDPRADFQTEVKFQLLPIPYSIQIFQLPSLFAGKMHAILHRQWKGRVKGRDYYDLIWYLGRGVPVDLGHLEARLRQSGGWTEKSKIRPKDLQVLLLKQFEKVDFEKAKTDIRPFIKDEAEIKLWSQDFFKSLLPRLKTLDR
jgi:predicted nucleotidyltransferase component of viral defense system